VPGGAGARTWGTNNEGRIVGKYNDANGTRHVFVTSDIDGSLCGDVPQVVEWMMGRLPSAWVA